MKILIIGSSGQLGKSIKKIVEHKKNKNSHKFDFVFTGRRELDLSQISSIKSYFDKNKFDVIVNCAAYTSVDKAEVNEKQANQVNHLAVKEIAKIAKKNNMSLIHISTDFVFDGLKVKPYIETDNTLPLNIYGKTKLDGENALLSLMKSNAIIIRTSWVYSEFGNNFVDTILNLTQNNTELNIISDQIGTPTYAHDIAQTILNILESEKFIFGDMPTKIYHYSNDGECSWYDFALEIINILGIECTINPVNAKDYPLPAKRPKNSLLSKDKIACEFDLNLNFWKDSLKVCLKNL